MCKKNIKLIFKIFRLIISEISKVHGMGQVYIQGQLEEARHQLELQHKIAKELTS
jgi:hypothetical protein